MPHLDLNPDIVRSVIDTVHEFHAGDDVNLRGEDENENVDEDLLMQFAEDYSNDPYYEQLTSAINDLEPDQQVSLVALMWLGRGDYTVDEWDDVIKQAKEQWTDHTAQYLISTPLLSDYLAEGLEQFDGLEE
jgi:hypothetical protein